MKFKVWKMVCRVCFSFCFCGFQLCATNFWGVAVNGFIWRCFVLGCSFLGGVHVVL